MDDRGEHTLMADVFLRWHVTAHCRTDNGPLDVECDIEELAELQERIENGPNWCSLIRIEVERHGGEDETMTVEESENL
jgi:hypothetical protein